MSSINNFSQTKADLEDQVVPEEDPVHQEAETWAQGDPWVAREVQVVQWDQAVHKWAQWGLAGQWALKGE